MLRRIPVIVILGSTGTGKTKLSLELAEKFGGEVISADSMQVYPGLDVVTAKATNEERQKVMHHLLDVGNPKEPYTVVHYRNMALPIIDNLLEKEKLPIVVGGTNYYIESLLWDILVSPISHTSHHQNNNNNNDGSSSSSSSSSTTETITEIMQTFTHGDKGIKNVCEFANQSSESLHNHLRQIDPITAGKLHPNNRRKIVRALEFFYEHGIPLSEIIEQQRKQPGGNRLGGPLRYSHTIIFWLYCNQDVLNLRLSKRVDSMLQQGLIKEIRDFYEKHVKDTDKQLTKGVLQTIGLKEFLPYLEKHDSNHDKIIEDYLKERSYQIQDSSSEPTEEPEGINLLRNCLDELKVVTIRYSKKQMKWINNRFLGYKDRQVPPLYKLDTSNVELWNENVYKPAVNIIESYMNNTESKIKPLELIRHPSIGLNEETLNFCAICKRHFVGEFQWKLHLKSNKHKRVKDGLNKKRKRTFQESSQKSEEKKK